MGEPFTPQIGPGFFTETTARGAPNRWKTGDKVRFHDDIPQKLGGWAAQTITGAIHYGIPRRTHEWSSLDGEHWIAYGTESKLYLINNGTRYNITPIRRTVSLLNPFATTIGSVNVLVTDVGHDAVVGGFVRFWNATAVGGLLIDGEYQIAEVIDGNVYRIVAASPAASTATGGGTVGAEYELNPGLATSSPALGYGVCVYGEDAYGTPRDEGCSGVIFPVTIWSLDNFGEDLIASPRGGAVYHWDRTLGPGTRAVILPDAPSTNQRVLISNSGGQIVCLGAFDSVAGADDKMLIRVGAEESLTEFEVDDENTVFEERVATGSMIITGARTRDGILVSTDRARYIMQEDGVEIFIVRKLAEGNPTIGPNAMLEVDGTVYEMTAHKFMRFDSVLEEMPCDVWDAIFQDPTTRVDIDQGDKVYAWYNEAYSEIWWHYPSLAGDGDNDRYVVFNKQARCWYFGALSRTAANPPGLTFRLPYAFAPNGTLYAHETGVDDNGAPMTAFVESHDMQLPNGALQMHVSRAMPDMIRQTGNIQLTLRAKGRPNKTAYVTAGPYTLSPTTETCGVRIKGRQIAIRMTSSALGDDWRMGAWTFEIQPDSEE